MRAVDMKSLKGTVFYLVLVVLQQFEASSAANIKLHEGGLAETTSVRLSENGPSETTNVKVTESDPFEATIVKLHEGYANESTKVTASEVVTSQTTPAQPFESPKHILFAADLFSAIVAGKSTENIVFSPASIQTCMALVFIGAEGETAEEMRQILRLGNGDKKQIAENFGKLLKTPPPTNNAPEEIPNLKMGNRVYVNDQLNASEEFKKISLKNFDTQVEKVNFKESKALVENVNQWVAQQTENKINELFKEEAFSRDTNAVFLNIIYFKAQWLNPFSQSSTSTSKFYNNLNHAQQAEIMYTEGYYGYAELAELEATALEMPYNNSDISMLIILPNEVEGLENLELKLRTKDLNDISSRLSLKKVQVYVPKFRIEFDIDLKEPLEKMGLSTTFTLKANFQSLFSTPEVQQSITDVKHKAFLDVNEAGSEAAAASFVTLTTLSAIFDEPVFRADHPFVFAIRSKMAVYFIGHVAAI